MVSPEEFMNSGLDKQVPVLYCLSFILLTCTQSHNEHRGDVVHLVMYCALQGNNLSIKEEKKIDGNNSDLKIFL